MNKADRILAAHLAAEAGRLALARSDIDTGAAELRTLAGGRPDLLVQRAGLMGGAWSAEPVLHWHHPLAVALLLAAADGYTEGLQEAIDLGRHRAGLIDGGVR